MATKAKLIRKAAVLSEHRAGRTIKEISRRYGIDAKTVRQYLHEDKMEKAGEKARIKAEEDRERAVEIAAWHKEGKTTQEIAGALNVSTDTVNLTLRNARAEDVDTEILYKPLTCQAARQSEIQKWAKKQAGKTLKTPDGKMTVAVVYPHILACIYNTSFGWRKATYTAAELYYMNAR